MEAIEEGAWVVPNPTLLVPLSCNWSKPDEPVFSTDVGLAGYTTDIDDDSENHEADTSDDFQRAENKFNLSN